MLRSSMTVIVRTLALLVAITVAPTAQAHDLTRVSVSSAGEQANDSSLTPAMSDDGRYVAFASLADNLVPDDENNEVDIFLHDRVTGETIRVSVNADGQGADDTCYMPAISADGQYVAFHSTAGNLVTDDTNGIHDVFVYDVLTGELTRVSISSSGDEGNDDSKVASLSADGRYVAFHTEATTLYPDDTNGVADIVVHDRATGETTRITLGYDGAEADGNSLRPSISADGRFIAFQSVATNLVLGDVNSAKDIFVFDWDTGTTTLASIDSTGVQGDGDSTQAWISAGGEMVVFQSAASNLVSDDTNQRVDVFVHDLDAATTVRASVDSYGIEGLQNSAGPVISANGRFVTFHSESSNLVPDDTNGRGDVFRHDLDSGTTIRISVTALGVEGNNNSGLGRSPISQTGAQVAFSTDAATLVSDDTNGSRDILVYSQDCDLPEILSQPEDQFVCAYDPAVFTVVATGTPELTYQWRKDSVAISGATADTYTIDEVLPEDAGLYDVVVTNDCGPVWSEAARLTVDTTIIESPADLTACDGAIATFSVTVGAPEPVTCQWRVDGVDIPDAVDTTLVIDPVGYADAGDYDVVVTSPCGAATSDPATLLVIAPVAITSQPTDQIACPEDELTLTVGATGGGTLSYQWRQDGEILEGQTDSTLYYSYAWDWMAGEYDVIVSNECSSVTSDIATVIVPSGVVVITEQPQDQEVCEGLPVTFTVTAESLAPLSYQWRKDGEEIPGATDSSYTIDSVTWDDYGEYSVIVWDACDSTASQNASLIVRLAPIIEQQPQPLEVCQEESATFTVSASGASPKTFQWQKDGVDIDDATQAIYTIDVVTLDDAGDYDVAVTNDCGTVISDPATLTVIDEEAPTIVDQPTDQTACIDGSATFSVVAEGTNLEYQWQVWQDDAYCDIPGATQSSYTIDPVTWADEGTYHVIVSNTCYAITSIDANLLIDDGVITIVQQPEDQTACEGHSVTFAVSVQATPPLSFQWRKDGVELPGATESSLTIELLELTDAGSYDVEIASTCGGATSDPAILTVLAYDPPVIITPPTDQTVCEGDGFVLSVEAAGTPPLSFQWRKDGEEIAGATEDTYVIDVAQPDDGGVYDVVVSNPCDTTTSEGATVTVTIVPVITRQPVDRGVGVEEGVTFVVEADGEALSYQWQKDGTDIPDTTESTYTIETVTLEHEGMYGVVVSNVCGTIASDTVALTLLDYPHTCLASISSTGAQGYDDSGTASVSGDGRYVTFVSTADNLAPSMSGDRSHVYLHDRQSLNTIRVTENPDNWQTNDDSFVSDMSEDECWVVFDSEASNIVPGDTNGVRDIFLIDLANDKTTCISVGPDGQRANGASAHPSISQDGSYVVFHSDADNLVADDTNGTTDVFVYCRQTGTITRVSVDSTGLEGNGPSDSAAMTDDGYYVVFRSEADNLVPDDTNNAADIFVYNLAAGETYRASVGTAGEQADGDCARPAISPGGNWVAFQSVATNLVADDSNDSEDIFVHQLSTGETFLVSRDSDGVLGNDGSTSPSISEDGLRIAFLSQASNLVADDTNGCTDVFLHDRESGATTRVSVASNGQQANGDSDWPVIASGGGAIVFQSDASNLVDDDTNASTDVFKHTPESGNTYLVSVSSEDQQGDASSVRPSLPGSADHYVLFSSISTSFRTSDRNGAFDIFSRDVQLDQTTLYTAGWVGNAASADAEVSADGGSIVFESQANNLVPADVNQYRDIFLYDVDTRTFELVSVDSTGEQADGTSYDPAVSGDGRFVAFASAAGNLLPSGSSSTLNIFVRDRLNQTTEWVSIGTDGGQPSSQADDPSISDDGRYVVYRSTAGNLVPDDTNGKSDIFVYDREMGTTVRISVDSAGNQSDDDSYYAKISVDGRLVTFLSDAENLVSIDGNDNADVFVHDLQSGETTLVSVSLDGDSGDDGSGPPSISADGRYVAFESNARNLTEEDTSPYVDTYVRDLQTSQTRIVSVDDLGQQGTDGDSSGAVISADGRYVVFECEATDLVSGDNNEQKDVFIHDSYGCLVPSILEDPASQTVYVEQTFTLSVAAAGTRPYEYQWRKDEIEIAGATTSELTVESPDPNDSGVYDVVVSNACGAIISEGAVVEVTGCALFNEAVSISNGGGDLLSASLWPSLSADGRYIAFHTAADNIVAEDAFGYTDVYVYDRHTTRVTWISRSYDGWFGNATSARPSLSADGRLVVFQSAADNVVLDDENGYLDVFLCDRDPDDNGTYDEGNEVTVRLSIGPSGEEGNHQSVTPVISADGRYVAFNSAADTLLPGGGGWIEHIYVRNLETDELTRVSVDGSAEVGDNDSRNPAISDDGRFIAFRSYAGNLVSEDTNPYPDIFVHDLETGTTMLVSSDAGGASVTGDNYEPSISGDGDLVAFASDAALVPEDQNGVTDIYVKDLESGEIERVSVDSSGNEADAGSLLAAISHDGRYVAFYSDATNLIPNDSNGVRDAFMHDRYTGATTLVSAFGLETQGDGASGGDSGGGITLSANGEWIAFVSAASNLVTNDNNGVIDVFLRDWEEARTTRVSVSGPGVSGIGISEHASLSSDGRLLVFQSSASNLVSNDTNGEPDVFLHDRFTAETQRLNLSPSGEQTPEDRDSGFPVVSADGRYVAYYSTAETLVPEDTNGRCDVFVCDVETGLNTLVSLSSTGEQGNLDSGDASYPIAISGEGRFVAFESRASNLVSNDTNEDPDIFVRDRDPDENGVFDEGNGVTERVSVDSDGWEVSRSSDKPTISADGRLVAFRSGGVFSPDDDNGTIDVFVHDRLTGITERVSIASDGTQANDDCDDPAISADGRYVAFTSVATNLHPLDTNAYRDVFVHDRDTGETLLASVSSASEAANNHSERTAISGDGRFVTFYSYASNLVPGDTNAYADVFVRDLIEETTSRVSIRTDGDELSGDSAYPAISVDGGVIALQTEKELVSGHINHGTNIFVQQRSDCLDPQILFHPQDQTVEQGVQVTFEVIANANPTPHYQWRKDGLELWGATFRTLTLDNTEPADAASYDVIVSNALGSLESEAATLSVAPSCPGDLDGDDDVDLADLAQLLGHYGETSGMTYADGDLDGDGDVDLADLAALLGYYGTTCD